MSDTAPIPRIDPALEAEITKRAEQWADLFCLRNSRNWDVYMTNARSQMIQFALWLDGRKR
jgi:hypothetical protein